MARWPGQLPANALGVEGALSQRVPMAEAPQALTRLATRATVGKVVVLPG